MVFTFDMKLDLSDIEPVAPERKTKYHTVPFTERDAALISEAKELLGKKNVAEIMRRAMRIGLTEALERFKPKAG